MVSGAAFKPPSAPAARETTRPNRVPPRPAQLASVGQTLGDDALKIAIDHDPIERPPLADNAVAMRPRRADRAPSTASNVVLRLGSGKDRVKFT